MRLLFIFFKNSPLLCPTANLCRPRISSSPDPHARLHFRMIFRLSRLPLFCSILQSVPFELREFKSSCKDCLHYRYKYHIVTVKYTLLQLPSIILSAVFYFSAGCQLSKGFTNSRKKMITVTFLLLWLLWMVLSAPYAFNEIYMQLARPGEERLDFFGAFDFAAYMFRHKGIGSKDPTARFTVEIVVYTVKQSFAFFNSFIMLILIRPFQEPIIYLGQKVRSLSSFLQQFCQKAYQK